MKAKKLAQQLLSHVARVVMIAVLLVAALLQLPTAAVAQSKPIRCV